MICPGPAQTQGALVVNNLLASAGDIRNEGSIPDWEDPLEGYDNSLQDSSLENPNGQRSLAGYGP